MEFKQENRKEIKYFFSLEYNKKYPVLGSLVYSQTLLVQYTSHSTPMIDNLHAIITASKETDKNSKTVQILEESVLYRVLAL